MIKYDNSQDDFLLISLRKKNELYHRKYVNKILYYNNINSQIDDTQRKNNIFFFTGGCDSIIKLWENNHSNKLRLLNNLEHHTNCITDLEISKNNNILFSSSSDSLICFWDLNKIIDIQNTNEEDNSIENTIYSDFNMINFDNYILCLKYNELNNILYFSDNQGNIFSFDINKENIINKEYNKIKKNEFLMENNYLLNSIDISIKGDILIASSNKDIIIIDTTTQKIISTLNGHNDEVIKVKLSLDGKKIISQSLDNTIKIWDIGEKKMTDNLNFINKIANFYSFKNFNDMIIGFSNGDLYLNDIKNKKSNLIEKSEEDIKEIIVNDEENQIIISHENGNLNIYDFELKNKNIYINKSKCIGEIDLKTDKLIVIIDNNEKHLYKSTCEIVKHEIIDYSIMNNQIYAILKYKEENRSDIVNLLALNFVENNNYNFEYLKNILEEVDEFDLEKWNDSNINTGILNIIFNEFNGFKNNVTNLNLKFIENIIKNEFYVNSSSGLYNEYDENNKKDKLKKNTFASLVLKNLLIYFLSKNKIFENLKNDLIRIYKYHFIESDNFFINTKVKKKNYSFYLKDNNNPNMKFPYFCFELFNEFNIYIGNDIVENNNQRIIVKLFFFKMEEYLTKEYKDKGHISLELNPYHTFVQLLKKVFSYVINVEKIKQNIDSYFQFTNYTNEQKKFISSDENLYNFFYFGVVMDDKRDSDNIIYLNKKNIYYENVSHVIKILNNKSTFQIYMHNHYEEAVSKMDK